jgi:hypothetical protein
MLLGHLDELAQAIDEPHLPETRAFQHRLLF